MTAKRETQEQKIKRLLDQYNKEHTGTTISNNSFVGVQYDEKAVEAITTIAEGLVINAESLGKLAEVLKASNVNIEAMIKVDSQ